MKKRKARLMTGIVVSDRMDKTITVEAERITQHSIYRRVIKRSKKYKAHDQDNKAKTGDKVRIAMTRPLSKTKCWRLVEVIK